MKLAIVEDFALIRDQLVRLVSAERRIRIVGTAVGEPEAVDLILQRQPDAVILDLSLMPGSGFRVLEKIRAAGSGARVLVLTNNANEAVRRACAAFGISGFYDKTLEVGHCLNHLFAWLPPLPPNEDRRLRALVETALLDGPGDDAFDGITRSASMVAESPIALITLLDAERQWFLARTGLALRETSRSIAFCAHAIAADGLTEIPDALADARFRDNPLVVGAPHIRFYAGLPLALSTGEALGTLCVLDTRPRRLNVSQRTALAMLARSAAEEIELRRHAAADGKRRLA